MYIHVYTCTRTWCLLKWKSTWMMSLSCKLDNGNYGNVHHNYIIPCTPTNHLVVHIQGHSSTWTLYKGTSPNVSDMIPFQYLSCVALRDPMSIRELHLYIHVPSTCIIHVCLWVCVCAWMDVYKLKLWLHKGGAYWELKLNSPVYTN